MTDEASFESEPDSVAQARRFTEQALGGISGLIAIDVVLMVSELATNAIVHAGTTFNLRIDMSADSVRVEVVDGGDGQVHVQSPSHSELHGRGLQLVETLSDQWGTREDGDAKAVWFVRTLASDEAGRHRRSSVAPPAPRAPRGAMGARRASGGKQWGLDTKSIAV